MTDSTANAALLPAATGARVSGEQLSLGLTERTRPESIPSPSGLGPRRRRNLAPRSTQLDILSIILASVSTVGAGADRQSAQTNAQPDQLDGLCIQDSAVLGPCSIDSDATAPTIPCPVRCRDLLTGNQYRSGPGGAALALIALGVAIVLVACGAFDALLAQLGRLAQVVAVTSLVFAHPALPPRPGGDPPLSAPATSAVLAPPPIPTTQRGLATDSCAPEPR